MMTREEALKLVRSKVSKKNLVKHMIATGACMRRLAEKLGHDPDKWEIAGILHDLDYDETYDKYELHAIRTVEMLREMGFEDEEILNAILAHAEKKPLESPIEKALYAVDPTTGFIVAAALMHPQKKIAALDVGFLKRRFKEKRFAAGASREQMRSCESLGLSLEEFFEICLEAMKGVSEELGL
ncbi:MAG: phosphohydrolase [Candidatus Hydrothermota bacterium]|nr:MAG: phosphohydrolase [Candidatus Hydrothermae bacterium]